MKDEDDVAQFHVVLFSIPLIGWLNTLWSCTIASRTNLRLYGHKCSKDRVTMAEQKNVICPHCMLQVKENGISQHLRHNPDCLKYLTKLHKKQKVIQWQQHSNSNLISVQSHNSSKCWIKPITLFFNQSIETAMAKGMIKYSLTPLKANHRVKESLVNKMMQATLTSMAVIVTSVVMKALL